MSDLNMFSLAVETYQRLLPELKQRVARATVPIQVQTPADNAPTVADLVELIQPTPPQTGMLGQCEDGAPFLLDLSGQETGSILLVGDPDSGKDHHLQTVVDSTIRLNAPHEVQVAVLTRNVDAWKPIAGMPGYSSHFSGIFAWYEQGAADLVHQLASLAEDRSSSRRSGATVLLVIDDLSGVFDADFETQNGLHWLLVDGPFSHIRPIASLDASLCSVNPFWVDTFRTFLIGKIEKGSALEEMGFSPEPDAMSLIPGLEYCAFMGQEWMKYRVPALNF